MAPPLLHFRRLHPQCLLLPRLRRSVPARLVLRLSFKTLCSSSSSDYSPARTPPPLHGPSLGRGRAPPDNPDPFARTLDLAALRVPAAACAPLERRLRGHLLNWPRVRNVARLPDDQGLLALGLSLPSSPRLSTEAAPPTTAVVRREKLAREFNARGFARFPNLARLSRPSPAARKRRERKAGGESDEEATRGGGKDKVYVVEAVWEGREGDEDDLKGLVGEEGLGRGAWRTGPSRLLLLDEKYAGRGVDELPEAVKVVLDHESHQNGLSAYELVHCQLTLFYNYWLMHESNSNSLANKVGILENLAKHAKFLSNSLANEVAKFTSLAFYPSARVSFHARTRLRIASPRVAAVFPKVFFASSGSRRGEALRRLLSTAAFAACLLPAPWLTTAGLLAPVLRLRRVRPSSGDGAPASLAISIY